MVTLKTATGGAEFDCEGGVDSGIRLRYGKAAKQESFVRPMLIEALLNEFRGRGHVVVGTHFSDPPLGSIGDWLKNNFGQNFACYLVPALEYLGQGGYDNCRRRFLFNVNGSVELESAGEQGVASTNGRAADLDGALLVEEASKAAQRISAAIAKLPLSSVRRIEFSLSDFSNAEDFSRHRETWGIPGKGEFVIYRFQVDALDEFYSAFPERSSCPCKLSRKNELSEDSLALYVGSSWDFAARLQQHLGFGYEGTYSLHLRRWVPEQLLGKELKIEYWTLKEKEDTRPVVLQSVEDYLWDHSRPVFGRRGSR